MNINIYFSTMLFIMLAAVLLVLITTGFGALFLDSVSFSGLVLITHISAGLLFSILFTMGCFHWIKTSRKPIKTVLLWCSIAFFIPVILSITVIMYPILDTSQMNTAAWIHHLSSFLFCIAFLPILFTHVRGRA